MSRKPLYALLAFGELAAWFVWRDPWSLASGCFFLGVLAEVSL